MKIAIDVHGVLQDPFVRSLLKPLMAAFIKEGHRVYILSGPETSQIHRELAEMEMVAGTHYNAVFSIVDYLMSKGVEMEERKPGHWWASDKDWWGSKGAIAAEEEIDIVIDDSPQYEEYMPEGTTFILVDQVGGYSVLGLLKAARDLRECAQTAEGVYDVVEAAGVHKHLPGYDRELGKLRRVLKETERLDPFYRCRCGGPCDKGTEG